MKWENVEVMSSTLQHCNEQQGSNSMPTERGRDTANYMHISRTLQHDTKTRQICTSLYFLIQLYLHSHISCIFYVITSRQARDTYHEPRERLFLGEDIHRQTSEALKRNCMILARHPIPPWGGGRLWRWLRPHASETFVTMPMWYLWWAFLL